MGSRSARIVARSPARQAAGAADDTPMMEQFRRAKNEAPGALLFFRMGDFYELFHEDAVVASRELGLTLTSRSKGASQAIPMAGVPVRSVDGYLVRLVRKGFKVAICEQLEDPRAAKGIVERGIVRIVTPGTLTEENALDARSSNYLASLVVDRGGAGLAWIDLSTGRLQVCALAEDRALDELARIAPAELLVAPEVLGRTRRLEARAHRAPRDLPDGARGLALRPRRGAPGADAPLPREEPRGLRRRRGLARRPAAGALIEYVAETQRATCEHVLRIEPVHPDAHLAARPRHAPVPRARRDAARASARGQPARGARRAR
jgi:DNA mismatch repair protein MutS